MPTRPIPYCRTCPYPFMPYNHTDRPSPAHQSIFASLLVNDCRFVNTFTHMSTTVCVPQSQRVRPPDSRSIAPARVICRHHVRELKKSAGAARPTNREPSVARAPLPLSYTGQKFAGLWGNVTRESEREPALFHLLPRSILIKGNGGKESAYVATCYNVLTLCLLGVHGTYLWSLDVDCVDVGGGKLGLIMSDQHDWTHLIEYYWRARA